MGLRGKLCHHCDMPYRIATLALFLVLAGCASAPDKNSDAATPAADTVAPPVEKPARAEVPERPFPDESFYALLVAEFALRRREYDLALDRYMSESFKLRDAGVSAHTTRLAQFMQREEEATEAGLLWVELEPDNPEARLTLANLLARQGRVMQALEQMAAILEAGGTANFTALGNGFEAMDAAQQATLLEQLSTLREKYPSNTQLMITIALLLEDMGQNAEALAEVQQVFAQTPNQLQAIVLEVKLRQDMGQTKNLYQRIKSVLKEEPENSRLRMQYARLLTRSDLAEAQRQFEILLKQSPNNPDLLFSLALIHRETGQLDQAREVLHKLLAIQQRTDEAHYYLGKTAEQQGRFEEALQHYMQVQPGHDFVNATNRIAAMLLGSNHTTELGQYFDRLRQRYPNAREQLYALQSDNLTAHNLLVDSLKVLDHGLEEFPTSTGLQYSRSMLYEKLGEMSLMEQDLRAIIEREPENATALNALGYTLANRTQRYAEAEQLIRQALDLDPEEPAILDSMGWVKYRLGAYQEALGYLQQAYELYPDPEVAAHLGEVLWALGEQDTAMKVWNTALTASPQHTVLLQTMQRLGANPKPP